MRSAVMVAGVLAVHGAVTVVCANEPVKYRVVDGNVIRESLTGRPGDPRKGAEIAASRTQGNCLACHALPMPQEKLQGNVGPDLTQVGARLSEGELRLRVVNPKIVDPQTAMPAYYRTDGLTRVRKDLVGKPILTAEQIEDVVAYLATLKQ
jgi:L-cysteine S-thiosulfotransferase